MRKQVIVERSAFYELCVVNEDIVSLNAITNSFSSQQARLQWRMISSEVIGELFGETAITQL